MNRKKFTLNEEFFQMKQLFGHMGISASLITESGPGGPGTGTAIGDAIGSGTGTLVRTLGSEVVTSIENSLIKAAKENTEFLSKIGKTSSDISLEDIKTAFKGATSDTDALGTIAGKNSTVYNEISNLFVEKLKPKTAEISSSDSVVNTVKSDLELASKNLGTDDNAWSTFADSLVILKQDVETVTDQAAKTKMKDIIETYETAVNTRNAGTTTTDSDIDLSKYPDIKKDYDLATTSQKNYVNEILKNITEDDAKRILNQINDAIENPTPQLMNSNGWDNFESGWRRFWRMAGTPFDVFTFKKTLTAILVVSLVLGFFWYFLPILTGDEKIPIPPLPDLSLDSPDKNCLDKVEGFSDLHDEEKKYAVFTFGCKRTRDDTSKNKIIAFHRDSDTEFTIRTEGECIETYKAPSVDKWLEGKLSSKPCSASEPEPEPEPELKPEPKPEDTDNNDDDENTTSCEHTLDDFKDKLTNSDVSFTGANWDQKTCTGTYSYEGKTYGPYDINLEKQKKIKDGI
jgi:hypothetical protein